MPDDRVPKQVIKTLYVEQGMQQWDHYPADDAFDPVSGYRWYYHAHRTKPVAERVYESHRKYIDIQYMLRGREIMVWAPLASMKTVTMPFDESKDAALYALIPDGVPVEVRAGQYAIFYPDDAHIPSCAWGEPEEILKVVVKVRV